MWVAFLLKGKVWSVKEKGKGGGGSGGRGPWSLAGGALAETPAGQRPPCTPRLALLPAGAPSISRPLSTPLPCPAREGRAHPAPHPALGQGGPGAGLALGRAAPAPGHPPGRGAGRAHFALDGLEGGAPLRPENPPFRFRKGWRRFSAPKEERTPENEGGRLPLPLQGRETKPLPLPPPPKKAPPSPT